MNKSKNTSQRRQEASRRNGALSKGPVTTEGKARSSRNAVKHGCLAALVTFTPEEAEMYSRIHAEYVIRFEPRDQVEFDLVEEIVRAKWQMHQAWAYQVSILGMQMARDAVNVDRDWKSLGDQDRRALAYEASVKDSNILANLQRYERSLGFQAERATKQLMELRKQRLPPADEPDTDTSDCQEPKEPSPTSEHPSGPMQDSPVTCAAESAMRNVQNPQSTVNPARDYIIPALTVASRPVFARLPGIGTLVRTASAGAAPEAPEDPC